MHASRARSLKQDGRDHSLSMKQPAVVPSALVLEINNHHVTTDEICTISNSSYHRHHHLTTATIILPPPLSSYHRHHHLTIATIILPPPPSSYHRHHYRHHHLTTATIILPPPPSSYHRHHHLTILPSSYHCHHHLTILPSSYHLTIILPSPSSSYHRRHHLTIATIILPILWISVGRGAVGAVASVNVQFNDVDWNNVSLLHQYDLSLRQRVAVQHVTVTHTHSLHNTLLLFRAKMSTRSVSTCSSQKYDAVSTD